MERTSSDVRGKPPAGCQAMVCREIQVAPLLLLVLATGAGVGICNPALAQGPSAAGKPRVDAYGDPLPEGAVARLGTARLRHGAYVSGLAFSGDGKSIFASEYYTGVHVWDADTGVEVRRFFPTDKFCHRLAASPDGKTLAVSVGDLSIRLCDPVTGRERGTIPREGNQISYLAFSHDGSRLAISDGRPWVAVWDVTTRKRVQSLTPPTHVGSVSFSADGKLLATGTRAGVCLWDLDRGAEVRRLKDSSKEDYPLYADFAPRGDLLAVWGYEDASVRVFTAGGTKEVRRFDQEGGPAKKAPDAWGWASIMTAGFAPDGKTLAIVRDVGRIELWDVETGKRRHTLVADSSHRPWRLAFSPDGTRLATTGTDSWGADHTIRVWDLAGGKELTPRVGHGAPISSVAVSPTGDTVATAGRDGVIHLWQAATGKHLVRLEAHPTRRRQRVTFTSDGQRVIAWPTYGGDGVLRIWDAKTGRPAGRFEVTGPDQYWQTVSDDGRTAVSVDRKVGLTRFHDLTTGKAVREVPIGPHHPPLELSPAGKAMVCSDGTLRTAPDRDLIHVGLIGVPNPTARFSADGRRVMAAVIPNDPTKYYLSDPPAQEVAVVDAVEGKELQRFGRETEHFRAIDAAGLSPDGKMVVTVSAPVGAPGPQVVTLWEAETGRERGHFVGHSGKVWGVAVSADGRFVVSGGDDTAALVWDATRPLTRDAAVRRASAAGDFAAHFESLAGDRAEQAYASIWALVNAPKEAVRFLGDQGSLFAATDVKRIERGIRDLDSDKYAERERASRELGKILDEAEIHLKKALRADPSPEARRRIDLLLKAKGPTLTGKALRKLRVIEILEHIATPDAVALLKKLAAEVPEPRLADEAKAALGRLKG